MFAQFPTQAPIQIEKSLTGTEQLFHPIDNALTPGILNSASFSFSAVDLPTIQGVLCFVFPASARRWCARLEESLNKQLKCGSHPHDRMSTGAETRSVSSTLRPAGGKQDGMGGSFCGKKSRFQDSAASIMGGKTAQKTEGRVIDNRCRRMWRNPITRIGRIIPWWILQFWSELQSSTDPAELKRVSIFMKGSPTGRLFTQIFN